MAERDELVGALGAHHAGDDRRIEDRALARAMAGPAQREGDGARQSDPRLGGRNAQRDLLGTHIDHRRAIAGIEVTQASA